MTLKQSLQNPTLQKVERQNIEKPIQSDNGIVFTPDTARGRVMVRRNPRADATSYQRDDEYRVPKEHRPSERATNPSWQDSAASGQYGWWQ